MKDELRRIHATITIDLYNRLYAHGLLNNKFDSWLANLIEEKLYLESKEGGINA